MQKRSLPSYNLRKSLLLNHSKELWQLFVCSRADSAIKLLEISAGYNIWNWRCRTFLSWDMGQLRTQGSSRDCPLPVSLSTDLWLVSWTVILPSHWLTHDTCGAGEHGKLTAQDKQHVRRSQAEGMREILWGNMKRGEEVSWTFIMGLSASLIFKSLECL